MKLAYIVLCLFPLLAGVQGEIGCFVAGECYNGVTGSITSQPDADACLEDCKDDPACIYFTYDKNTDACVHLSACDSLTNTYYTNLFTGHATCDNLQCGNHGHCDGNSLTVMIADTAEECFDTCAQNTNCNWWTYSYNGDKFCSLFEDCPRVDTSCDYCLHGQRACENVTRCEDPWHAFPGSSKCVQVFSELKEYGLAQAACRDAGANGNLLSIHSQVQHDFLVDLIVADDSVTGVYIGLNDMITEGDFQWVDGSEVDFTLWRFDQPDNDGSGEDCVHLWENYGFEWNDVIESYATSYACQIDRY